MKWWGRHCKLETGVNAAVRYLVYLIRLATGREVEASKSGARATQGSGDIADWWLMYKGSQGAKQGSLECFTLYTCALHFKDNTYKD